MSTRERAEDAHAPHGVVGEGGVRRQLVVTDVTEAREEEPHLRVRLEDLEEDAAPDLDRVPGEQLKPEARQGSQCEMPCAGSFSGSRGPGSWVLPVH